MARLWDHQKWGRCHDLIHQSDLNGLIGKFGCPQQFKRKKIERATGGFAYENAGGKLAAGNAVHAVLHRILKSEPARAVVLHHPHLPSDPRITDAAIATAYDDEFATEVAGRPVSWYKTNADKLRAECLAMLRGVLDDMHNHVAEVVLAECAFVYQLDGLWLTGAIDLLYRARVDGEPSPHLSFADWKTGAQRPHQIDLDHGWQSGIYSGAMARGYFVPFEAVPKVEGERHRDTVERASVEIAQAWQAVLDVPEGQTYLAAEGIEPPQYYLDDAVQRWQAVRFDEYPERIRYVHLRDYIPYARKQTKMLSRPEEISWAGLEVAAKVSFEKGDTRGPAWYHVNRAESDLPRLRSLLRAVVSWVRFGRFPAAPGEMCSRCKFREPCLLDGYQPIGDAKKQLDLVAKSLDFDGFDFDEI